MKSSHSIAALLGHFEWLLYKEPYFWKAFHQVDVKLITWSLEKVIYKSWIENFEFTTRDFLKFTYSSTKHKNCLNLHFHKAKLKKSTMNDFKETPVNTELNKTLIKNQKRSIIRKMVIWGTQLKSYEKLKQI